MGKGRAFSVASSLKLILDIYSSSRFLAAGSISYSLLNKYSNDLILLSTLKDGFETTGLVSSKIGER